MHCMNNRLQLAVSKSFKTIRKVDNIDEMLMGLFKYHHNSTVRTESLNAIQNILRDMGELENKANLTIKKAVHTRWLSHEQSLQTVRKFYVHIVKDLENAVSSGRDKTIRDNHDIPACSLLKALRSYEKLYLIYLHPLPDCLNVRKLP